MPKRVDLPALRAEGGRWPQERRALRSRLTEIGILGTIVGLILLVFLLFSLGKPKEDWVDIAKYLGESPLIVSVVGALIIFLAVDRFRELAKKVSDLEERIYELTGTFSSTLDRSIEETQAQLADRWERIETRLRNLTENYPFLEALDDHDLLVNSRTTVAALGNVRALMSSGKTNLAYEVLYFTATRKGDQKVFGTPKDFESLALVALVSFEDEYLCDLLLSRASAAAGKRHPLWSARRLQMAILTGRLSLAADLSVSLKRVLFSDLLRGLASLLRINMQGGLIRPDHEEVVASLYLASKFADTKYSILDSRRLRHEYSQISKETSDYISSFESFLSGEPYAQDSLEDLFQRTGQTPYALLAAAVSQQAASESTEVSLKNSLSKGRPLVRKLYEPPSSENEVLTGAAGATPPEEKAMEQPEFVSEPESLFPGYQQRHSGTSNPLVSQRSEPPDHVIGKIPAAAETEMAASANTATQPSGATDAEALQEGRQGTFGRVLERLLRKED